MSDRPSTSFVILTRNQLDYTRRCVEGIQRHTPEPHELVFVDNASTDGTLEYLRSIPDAIVIDNDENHGFGGGCNQGMAASTGDRILLLNNDVVPTHGWLGALHDAIDADPHVSLAGPRTNRIAGTQQVDDVGYDQESLAGLDEWAQEWTTARRGRRTPILRLVGFCILMERAVVDRIGGFDLRYEIGNFEDDDLCLRAGVAGFGCSVAEDSFIHHFGSRTFAGENIDFTSRMAENYRRFMDAWGMTSADLDPETLAYPVQRLVTQTSFDRDRHFAPLVGVPDLGARVAIDGARDSVCVVCCDRIDPAGTRDALDEAFDAHAGREDVTVVVRIDPRDRSSMQLLEQSADAHDAAGLPDVVVVQARDDDDRPVLRVADEVVVAGRQAWARSLLARRMGVAVRSAY
ncbi:MAG: glycosyltransferase family 2 protein [Thermoleophilia bacterium]|nr:glycosyltransferase family 2 protein [Thermoleophilia bacterium]